MDLPLPFIFVDGVSNVRTLGGYPTPECNEPLSISTRQDFFYRCADLIKVTDAGRATLQSLGITAVYDLRSLDEGKKAQDAHGRAVITDLTNSPLGPNITRHETPIFAHENWSPEAAGMRYLRYAQRDAPPGAGYAEAYREMLERGHGAIRRVLLHVRDRAGEPFAVHCSAGKDRTGVVVAVLMKLAGCEDEVVAREYALTEVGLGSRKAFIVKYLLSKPEMQGSQELAEMVAGAPFENMWETLQMVRRDYGGMSEYVRRFCGLTESDIAVIRRNLTCSDAPSPWGDAI
ncbi:tyrosine-protein phosphatase [Aspergillus alliaceus]|uniref:tyrosine-protein phosphatase n=1 Tax=Petromyces alliaceus TaxID=209559 RepID=UPI0012A6EADC|nr:protein-tyrosine phosphatase-like protein [Aspergillus alliaceus]KAB8236168.1 protein-tyrosine phosphatase-like protein [Aspergillus alliaceus]